MSCHPNVEVTCVFIKELHWAPWWSIFVIIIWRKYKIFLISVAEDVSCCSMPAPWPDSLSASSVHAAWYLQWKALWTVWLPVLKNIFSPFQFCYLQMKQLYFFRLTDFHTLAAFFLPAAYFLCLPSVLFSLVSLWQKPLIPFQRKITICDVIFSIIWLTCPSSTSTTSSC